MEFLASIDLTSPQLLKQKQTDSRPNCDQLQPESETDVTSVDAAFVLKQIFSNFPLPHDSSFGGTEMQGKEKVSEGNVEAT